MDQEKKDVLVDGVGGAGVGAQLTKVGPGVRSKKAE